MARVTVEDCIEQIPNRFDLVLKAAHLAREINGGLYMIEDQSKIEKKDREKSTVLALREIGDKHVSNEIIEKRFILNTIRNTYGVEVGILPQYDSQNHRLSHFATASADGEVEIDVDAGSKSLESSPFDEDVSKSTTSPISSIQDKNLEAKLAQEAELDNLSKADETNDSDIAVEEDDLELKNSPLATLYSDKQSNKSENVEKYDSKFEDHSDD